MINFFQSLLLTFIPLFVVMDPFDKVPIIVCLSEDMSARERFQLINVATITAAIVGVVFLLFGQLTQL